MICYNIMKKRKNDLILIIALLVVSLLAYLVINFFIKKDGNYVIVTVDGQEVYKLDLNKEQEVTIHGTNGDDVLVISNGKASMVEASCPDQLCVHQKSISKNGETIVCLPNKIVVEVVSDESNDVDAISN